MVLGVAGDRVTASEGFANYARLAWLPDYRTPYALDVEQSSGLIGVLSNEFVCAYARRKMVSGSERTWARERATLFRNGVLNGGTEPSILFRIE